MTNNRFFAFQRKYAATFNPIDSWPESFYRTLYSSTKWPGAVFHNVCDPELVREVLVDRMEDFIKAPLTQSMLTPMLGEGLVTAQGPRWLQQRKAVSPAFRPRIVDELIPIVVVAAEKLADQLAGQDGDTPTPMLPRMAEATFSIVANGFLGSSATILHQEEAADALGTYLENYAEPESEIAQAAIRHIHAVAAEVIADRRQSGEATQDLLGLLISGAAADLPESDIRDNIVTFLIAGHETTAAALTWAVYLLASNTDVQERAYQEVMTCVGSSPLGRNYETLHFLRRVSLETMRLYPPIPNLFREAIRDTQIGSISIAKGDMANLLIYPMHRNTLLWDDPNAFDPDRFLPERSEGRHPFSYLPFSAGPRGCIGSRLAQLEFIIILAAILRRCRFSSLPDYKVKPFVRVSMRPHDGLPLYVSAR